MTVSGLNSTSSTLAFSSSRTCRAQSLDLRPEPRPGLFYLEPVAFGTLLWRLGSTHQQLGLQQDLQNLNQDVLKAQNPVRTRTRASAGGSPEPAYGFDLRAVGQLLHRVAVLRVVLQQDGHLEGGGLQGVPEPEPEPEPGQTGPNTAKLLPNFI